MKHLAVYFGDIVLCGKSAAELYQENVGTLSIPWLQLRSNRTCLLYNRRKPESQLSCGYTICNVYIRIFGDEMPVVDGQFHISTCPLCRSGTCMVRLKPFSAGERLLAIDRGGRRSVIPLEILAIIQGIIGSELQVQDFFDIVFGTSVGEFHVPTLLRR